MLEASRRHLAYPTALGLLPTAPLSNWLSLMPPLCLGSLPVCPPPRIAGRVPPRKGSGPQPFATLYSHGTNTQGLTRKFDSDSRLGSGFRDTTEPDDFFHVSPEFQTKRSTSGQSECAFGVHPWRPRSSIERVSKRTARQATFGGLCHEQRRPHPPFVHRSTNSAVGSGPTIADLVASDAKERNG